MGDNLLLEKYGRVFPTGHTLFREGEGGKEMFVIISGKVTISKKVRNKDQVLVTLPPGEFFGEMSILNNKPRSATATVAEDCKLLVIDPKTFEDMVKNNGEIALRMIKKLAERLRAADEQISNLMHKDCNSRVVHLLTSLAESSADRQENGILVKITVEDLSYRVGMDLEPVNEVINKLVKSNLVKIVPDGFIISDPNQLRKFLEFLAMKEQFGELA